MFECGGVATSIKAHFKGVARRKFEFGVAPYMWKNRVVALGGVGRHRSVIIVIPILGFFSPKKGGL